MGPFFDSPNPIQILFDLSNCFVNAKFQLKCLSGCGEDGQICVEG